MTEQPTEIRPDGTPIYGPPMPDFSKVRGQAGFAKVLIPFAAVVLIAFGYVTGGGLRPEPTWQELYQARLVEGCLPLAIVTAVGTQAEADQMADGNDRAVAAIHTMYPDARDIESDIAQAQGLKIKNPKAEIVAFVTLERCL